MSVIEDDAEVSPLMKKLLESKEFKRAVMDVVADTNIPADNIEDLDSAIENVINSGDFDAETTVSFRA